MFFIKILNNRESNNFEWIHIIKVLKGLQNESTIRIYDKNLYKKFAEKVRYILSLLRIQISINGLFLVLSSIIIVIIFYDLKEIIIYGILSGLIYCGFLNTFFIIMSYSFFYYLIVCFYCKLRFKLFNSKLLRTKKVQIFLSSKTVFELTEEHNNICNNIILHNKFWSKYLFAMTYTIIPINLMVLQQILFEDLLLASFYFMIFFEIFWLFSHLMINSITASINKESSNSYKYLFKFYVDSNPNIGFKNKIKVSFEIYFLLYK
jgi:hypothetical protein